MDPRKIKALEGRESFKHLPPRNHIFSTEVAVWKEWSNATQHSDESEAGECMQSLAWTHTARFMLIPQKHRCLRAGFRVPSGVFAVLFDCLFFKVNWLWTEFRLKTDLSYPASLSKQVPLERHKNIADIQQHCSSVSRNLQPGDFWSWPGGVLAIQDGSVSNVLFQDSWEVFGNYTENVSLQINGDKAVD